MSEDVKRVLLARLMYCNDRNKYCRAGGYVNWLKVGIVPYLHPNYGLPCVGGTITYQDGVEVISPSCIFCGSVGRIGAST